jgi:hypothetical protein
MSRKVVIRLRPVTMEGRLVTWLLACMVAGVGVGTAAALIAWAALFFRKGATVLMRLALVRVVCFCFIA